MSSISEVLKKVSHRPWALPDAPWQYSQQWNDALFLHWAMPPAVLRSFVPKKLNIDLFDEKAYVSLVIFTMQKVRPRFLPPLRMVSNFHEINVRTYVEAGGKQGVYFFSLEAEKWLSALLARWFSGLGYTHSMITRKGGNCRSKSRQKGFSLEVSHALQNETPQKLPIDLWLTERYCAFYEDGPKLFRYDIHHPEWPMQTVSLEKLALDYAVCDFNLNQRPPDLIHYSPGVGVATWPKVEIQV